MNYNLIGLKNYIFINYIEKIKKNNIIELRYINEITDDKINDMVHKEVIRKLVDMISNDVVDKLLKEENNE